MPDILEYLFQSDLSNLENTIDQKIRKQDVDILRQFFFLGAYHSIMVQRYGLRGLNPLKPEETVNFNQSQLIEEAVKFLGLGEDFDEEDEEGEDKDNEFASEERPKDSKLH